MLINEKFINTHVHAVLDVFIYIDISIRYMIGHDPRKTVLIIVHSLSRFLCMDWSGSKIILKYDIVMLNQMSV